MLKKEEKKKALITIKLNLENFLNGFNIYFYQNDKNIKRVKDYIVKTFIDE